MSRTDTILANFRREEDLIRDRLDDGIRHHRMGHGKVQVVDENGKPVAGARLHLHLQDHDFKMGANIFMLDEFECAEKNAAYREMFPQLFNLATVPFYWSDLEPEEGKPRFAADSPKVYRRPAPDLCVDYCKEVGITPKCHCLNYDVWTPLWAPDDVTGIKRALDKRIRECAERYRDVIPGWEVTNELYCGKYDTYAQNRKSSQFFTARDNVEWSFNTARRYLPNNELIINEASHAWTSLFTWQRGAYYQQIERALDKGAPIDAVGMQFHMFCRAENEERETKPYYTPSHLYNVMDTYAKLGLPMQITEITIPCYTDLPEDEELQAEVLRYLMEIWFSHPAMEAAIYWNLVDGYAAFAPQGDMKAGENYFRAGLCRFDMTPKPAYYMLKKLFHETWHTEVDLVTDEGGWANWNGFWGKYGCTIAQADKTTETTVHLTKDSGNSFRVISK